MVRQWGWMGLSRISLTGSCLLLHTHLLRSLHTVFRLQSNANALVADFALGQGTDEIVTVWPSDNARTSRRRSTCGPCARGWSSARPATPSTP